MNIISQSKQSFDTFLKNTINNSDSYVCKLIGELLESYDLELAATRDKSLEIVKKVSRTILSSRGPITFKRRYYYDTINDRYVYLLDSIFKIPKYSRISEELKIKILNSLDHLSYEDAGIDNLPPNQSISAVSVFNILNKASIEVDYSPFKKEISKRVHVQIDEKYISMKSKRKKASNRRVYTACIFTDIDKTKPNRHRLINRLIISARTLPKFFQRINNTLKTMYGLTIDDTVYISGDLASYIQKSPEKITVCKALYVADKFHVQSLAKKLLGRKLEIDDLSRFDDYINAYIEELNLYPDHNDINFIALYNLLLTNSNSIKRWYNIDYLGCSQECINSHYFADRLDKKPNTFTTKSLDKLCDLMNAKHNNMSFKIETHESYYDIEYNYLLKLSISDLIEEHNDYYISYSQYSYPLKKVLKKISGLA